MWKRLWKALTKPHADPQALACPLCGSHRFNNREYPKHYVECRGCGEEMPSCELVIHADEWTAHNYRVRTYGTELK